MAGINGFGNYGNYGNYGKYNYNGNNAWDKKQAGLNSGLKFNSNQGDGFVRVNTGGGEEPIVVVPDSKWSEFWERIGNNFKAFIDEMNKPTGDAYGNGWGKLFAGCASRNPCLDMQVNLHKAAADLPR